MKIFYGIAGEGCGHATRSRPLIQYLLQKHDVSVFAGGKANTYLRRWFSVKTIASMRLKYRSNHVATIRTAVYNLFRLPQYVISFLKVFMSMLLHNPDVVITDFEPWTAWSAVLLRIPLLSIHLPGHYLPPQPFIRNNASLPSAARFKGNDLWDRFTLWLITSMTIPYANKVVIPSFFRIPLKDQRAQYVQPIIRDEILKRKSVVKNHVLVYQTTGTYVQLISVLKQFPQQQFIVYGFEKSGIEQNVVFKSFNEAEFFDDLCSAKGVITNGGISLMTEAVFLGKQVLSIPIRGQGEQRVNAFFLEKEGYGFCAAQASMPVMTEFLNKLNRVTSSKSKKWNTKLTCQVIEGTIQSLVEKVSSRAKMRVSTHQYDE